MGTEQRAHLVSIARQYDLTIIEDAAYAFLIEKAPLPMVSLAPERTVYVSGLSKSVATGLRVGFVVAPIQQRAGARDPGDGLERAGRNDRYCNRLAG